MKEIYQNNLFKYYFFNNCDNILKDLELTKQECMFLIITYTLSEDNKHVLLKTIRERMEMSKPAISILMSKLEKKGYIKRHLNKNNLREIYVKLSEYSMKIAEETINRIDTQLSLITERMGKEKMDKLIELNDLFSEISKIIIEEGASC